MKHKKTILSAILIITVLIFISFKSQSEINDSVMIRTYQASPPGKQGCFIKIYKGDGTTERIPLEELNKDTEDKNYGLIMSTIKTYEKKVIKLFHIP